MRQTAPQRLPYLLEGRGLALSLAFLLVLAGCSGGPPPEHFPGERFAPNGDHRQVFAAPPARVCGAAAAALLEQGYVLTSVSPDQLTLLGTKQFQEKDNRFATLQVQAACRPQADGTALFVTAVESRFDVAKQTQKSGIGLPLVGPVTVTRDSSAESQVQRGGETVEDPSFYGRFYAAVRRALSRP